MSSTTTRDEGQLNSWRSERTAKRQEQAEKEARKAEADAQIARLKEAKALLIDAKSNVDDLKKGVKGKEDQADGWQGFNHNWYAEYLPDTFRTNYKNYYDEIDDFLDAICNKITQLENESRDLWEGINWLVSAINSLSNRIETWFN